MREQLSPLFEEYDVDVVFTGHDHNLQRSKPMKSGSVNEEDGIIYIVGGVSGSQLRNPGIADWHARATKQYHFIYVSVSGNKADFKVINKDGRIIDRFDIVK